MNRKGQVLVLFLMLLPVFIVLFGYIVDKCYLMYQNNKLNNIGSTVCSYSIKESDINKVKQLALENDKELTKININKKNNKIEIILEKEIDSLFGNLLGIDNYNIKTRKICK